MTEAVAAQRVPRARFSVDHLPPQARYEVWQDSMSCLFRTDRGRTLRQSGEFRASVDALMIGPLMLAETATSAQSWARSESEIARDGLDHVMIQIYLNGTQRCASDGRDIEMPRTGALVYDLSRPMQARSSDLRNLSLILPRAVLEDRLADPDGRHMGVIDPARPMGGLFIEHVLSLRRHAGRMEAQAARAMVEPTVQICAAALNATAGSLHPDRDRAALQTLVRRDIRARLSDPELGPEDLRRRHGLSRHRLYSLFSCQGGVAAHIRETRLRAAMALLSAPEGRSIPVAAAAARCGFASASDFSRAFSRRFGMSPRAARHYAAAPASGPASLQNGVDRRYETWLRRLSA